jgi:hypothetical protein
MSYQQIAKLYIRGKRDKRIKDLPPLERQEIEDIIYLVINDPNLQRCQHEFCNALARTIKNEYVDTDVGRQDFRIAVMRAALAAKENPSSSATITDPVQRKKWFQTYVFNYLRQILRENKIPMIRKDIIRRIPIELQVLNNILKEIKNSNIEDLENGFKINTNISTIPTQGMNNIQALKDKYLNQVNVTILGDSIVIERICEPTLVQDHQVSETSIKEHSFDTDDDTKRNIIEAEAGSKRIMEGKSIETCETFQRLRYRIPAQAEPILNIYFEDSRPDTYIERFGNGSPKIAHIAQFMGVSTREVKKLVFLIRIQMMVLNLGY